MFEMKRFIIIFILGIFLLFLGAVWGYSNPEKIETFKSFFKERKKPILKVVSNNTKNIRANSFSIELSEILSISEKTAFIIYNEEQLNFDRRKMKIYTQNGYLIENLNSSKLNLPSTFTMARNGGIKTIIVYKKKQFALISSSKEDCFYASIINLDNGSELFKSKCLPGIKKEIDFNGLGSSNIHYNNKIYLSLGAPEQSSSEIAILAQDINSIFGKILEIDKENLEKLISNKETNLEIKIFSLGHRNPQGLTKINNNIFSVEHGPLGGDELNRIIQNKNYGWPTVSYGTKYLYDDEGISYKINHELENFEEPLFALLPSVGISALNTCPSKLKKFYNKPCLIALSLNGNNLRPGKSIIIYLLSEKMDKVHSVEQIYLGDDYRFRHFVTNSENILYEDADGNIYVSVDKKGIYRVNFLNFR